MISKSNLFIFCLFYKSDTKQLRIYRNESNFLTLSLWFEKQLNLKPFQQLFTSWSLIKVKRINSLTINLKQFSINQSSRISWKLIREESSHGLKFKFNWKNRSNL